MVVSIEIKSKQNSVFPKQPKHKRTDVLSSSDPSNSGSAEGSLMVLYRASRWRVISLPGRIRWPSVARRRSSGGVNSTPITSLKKNVSASNCAHVFGLGEGGGVGSVSTNRQTALAL